MSAANLPIQKFATANPSILQRRLTDQRAVAALQLTRRLPAATPIGKMLTPSAAEGLTPGARTLTKADLSAMQLGRVSATAAKLTVKDIESVQKAFGQIGGLAASIDVSCCCCTPCCCAAAVEPVLALAA
ncbi:MAG: hypothetical protein B7Y47_11980 [Sphingomonas sp. 28-63-12]|nr:MAG: hypothetical protein B7Y47_11980 [Sphingomonas sp. 28-63-12]